MFVVFGVAELKYADLDDVLSGIRQAVRVAQNEEELRLRVSAVMRKRF